MNIPRDENEKQEDNPDLGLVPAVKVDHRVLPAQIVQVDQGGLSRRELTITMIND